MITENLVGVAVGTKLINNKLKPSKSKSSRVFGILFFLVCIVGGIMLGLHSLVVGDYQTVIISVVGVIAFSYGLALAPVCVKDVEVGITKEKDIVVTHKGKEVQVDLKKDSKGKYLFANPTKKHLCVRYADNSHISNFNRYRIVNYLASALMDNDLLSDEVKLTLE